MSQKIIKTIYPKLFIHNLFLVPVLLSSFLNASCTSFGAEKVVSSHTSYNDSVQLTVSREVLTNIVRSRYLDPMQFLTVSAINAQFSVNDDTDLNSRVFLEAMVAAYTSRVGSQQAGERQPDVVIPIGGG